MNEAPPALSRRRLIEIIGASVGGAAAYQAMTRLGHAEESPLPRSDQARRRSQGRLGHRSRRRARRNDDGDRARARRLQSERARIQRTSGRAELEPPGRRRLHGARRRDAKVRVRRRPLSQSRAMAHSLSSLRDPGLLPPFRRARSSRSSSSITTPICIPPTRSTASRSAFATSRPISTAASPSFWPRRRKRERSTTRCRRRIRRSCSKRCGRWARSTRISAIGWARISASHRGYAKHSGGGLGAEPIAGEPIGLHDILTSRLWRGLQSFLLYDFQTTMFQPVGGMGRIGEAFRAADPGSHSIWRESRRHPAGRQRRDRRLRGPDVAGGTSSGGQGRLVRVHASAQHSEPDPDQRVRAYEGGDRRCSLCVRGEVRAAVQAPVLGGGRAHLRRHQLHRSADPADLLSQHEFQRRRQGRAARRLHVRRTPTPTSSRRCRRPSA